MKKFVFLAAAGLLLLVACKNGTGQKLTTEEAIKQAASAPGINAGSNGFSIDAPSGWTKSDTSVSGMKVTLVFAPDVSNGFRSNVNVVTQSLNGLSGQAYYDATSDFMAKNMVQFKEIEKGHKIINGNEALFLHYNDAQQGRVLDQCMYLIPHGGIAYIITTTTPQGDGNKYQKDFDESVHSFTLK